MKEDDKKKVGDISFSNKLIFQEQGLSWIQ